MRLGATNQFPSRRGLTLVELVVVLVVLAAVAGILVPLFGTNVARKGSTSSSLTNVSEIEKIMALYANRHPLGHYPDQYDSLRNDAGAVFAALPGNGTGLTAHPLSSEEAAALRAAGVTTVRQMSDTPPHPTFHPYDTADFGTPIAIEDEVSLVTLTVPAAQSLGLPPGGRYVVFGLGAACTLFAGNDNSEASAPPVRFSGQAQISPSVTYQRFGVVFQVADAEASLPRARFVRAVGFGSSGPVASDQLVREWYD